MTGFAKERWTTLLLLVACVLLVANIVKWGIPARTPQAASAAPSRPQPLPKATPARTVRGPENPPQSRRAATRRSHRLVRVIVALCDNQYQGIAPVPAALGNGQNPAGNLYWGAMYGLKSYFARSKHWRRAATAPSRNPAVLERVCFRYRPALGRPVLVVAEAYDGRRMEQALRDFLRLADGDADLVCFIGHNGLMEIPLPRRDSSAAAQRGGAVVLACQSRVYFSDRLMRRGRVPLVLTNGNMAPEAYTLDAILRSWANGATPAQIRRTAGLTYARYQRISQAAGLRLFASSRSSRSTSTPGRPPRER